MNRTAGTVYIIQNTENDKAYIGQTVLNLQKRLNNHIREARLNKVMPKNGLHQAMLDIGFDKFYIKPLEENVPVEKLYDLEKHYIQIYQTQKNGYNTRAGEKGGVSLNEEDVNKVIEMVKEGKTNKEIAKYFGVHRETIRRVLLKKEIKRKRGKYKERLNMDFIEMEKDYYNQMDIKDICKKYDINIGTFYNIKKELNIKNRPLIGKRWRNHKKTTEGY